MNAKQRKRELTIGILLMIVFMVVLVLIFSPLFGGQNGLEYMDSLYNSISKGSAYYIPAMKESAAELNGQKVDTTLTFGSEVQAERTAILFNAAGAQASASGKSVSVSGDLGAMVSTALVDADDMYNNNDQALAGRYGYDGKAALFNWWAAINALDKSLTKEKRFDLAKTLHTINGKALETAYNYFGVAPEKISAKLGLVVGSLVFYVIYTLWYGFSILFMFEGSGFRLEH